MPSHTADRKVTLPDILARKGRGARITMLTAYDATFARLCDQAGVDMLLVGDSLGMVIQGLPNTLPVTLDEVIYHTRAVARGARRAHVVGDMPFMSYQASVDQAVANAGRLIKEGGAESVKLEGGEAVAEVVRRCVRVGIPVLGHVGLTPQSVHAMGGFKVQGKTEAEARRVMADAKALEEAGAYGVVLEGVPRQLGAEITRALKIPTIGIGAGPECDGQVLVLYDMLGLIDDFKPRFVRRFESLALRVRTAVEEYVTDVSNGRFPAEEHCFGNGGGNGKGTPAKGPTQPSAAVTNEEERVATCIPLRAVRSNHAAPSAASQARPASATADDEPPAAEGPLYPTIASKP
jgi:3-methyl-2-oxobutanoate hydroxymethyltransferase